MLPILHKQVVT